MRFKPDLWNSQICLSTLKFTAPFTCTASHFQQTAWNHSKGTTKSGYAAHCAIENSGGNTSAPWSRGMSSQSTMSSKATAALNALLFNSKSDMDRPSRLLHGNLLRIWCLESLRTSRSWIIWGVSISFSRTNESACSRIVEWDCQFLKCQLWAVSCLMFEIFDSKISTLKFTVPVGSFDGDASPTLG